MLFKTDKLVMVEMAILMVRCKDQNEDVTQSVNKSGSVETSVQIKHVDSTIDDLVTIHKVWVKDSVYKTFEYHDTIPALPKQTIPVAGADERNEPSKNEYEIYITVK